MIEMNYTVCMGRWLNGELNPDRVEAYLVRGKTKKDCLELLNAHARGCRGTTAYHLRQFAHWCWGTRIKRPTHQGRGVWLTRDHGDTEMIAVWEDQK